MFKFDNTHIFTGYLKQKLSSVNIPTCKIYTREFANYLTEHGKEDPRVIESIDTVDYRTSADESNIRLATQVNYLIDNEVYNYFWKYENYSDNTKLGHNKLSWRKSCTAFYSSEKPINGLTKTLVSPGCYYDTTTHEYLGDYLRFLRDYHSIDLMSLYNCFTNKICPNLDFKYNNIIFNSQDSMFKIYVIPVKLFANYTIALDSYQDIELFCGLYGSVLDTSPKALELITKTYKRINRPVFKQPFLYDSLDVKYWSYENEIHEVEISSNDESIQTKKELRINNECISRWDINNREKDLKLFIKIPISCKSSITILEGDYRTYNNFKYTPISDKTSRLYGTWNYQGNHSIINFNTTGSPESTLESIDLNKMFFKPIGKLQLLEFNTGESYPFADRLVEYLSNSAITPIDEIPDNIKRVQKVMKQNNHNFRIEGLWECKMQAIIYDYIVNSGPVTINNDRLFDLHRGYHHRLGHVNKSTLYDVLGYIDRDAEKWYASWKKEDNKAVINNTIQNIDIYNRLYDI